MRRLPRPLVILLAVAFGAGWPGCALVSDQRAADSGDTVARSGNARSGSVTRASYDESVDSAVADDSLELADFSPNEIGLTVKRLTGNGPDREVAQQLYEEAESRYDEATAARSRQDREAAREAFLEAADSYAGAAARWPDSAMEEDALFRAGECQFFADRYVQANGYFEQLLKKYPNSRYLDLVGARRFVIAQYWLDLHDAHGSPWLAVNLLDKKRPWSDMFGHAVRIYDRMRLEDPTGKLADDATMAAANALFARGDYVRADEYYSDLRRHFPSSEHQFLAHYLGIQAKLRGYRGPEFAGDVLDEAEELIKQARRQFAKEAREHEQELAEAYHTVRYLKAQREWTMAEYYRKRREYGAARFYLEIILDEYGETSFADKARKLVPDIAGKPRTPPQRLSWLVDLFPDGNSPAPVMAAAPDDTQRR